MAGMFRYVNESLLSADNATAPYEFAFLIRRW